MQLANYKILILIFVTLIFSVGLKAQQENIPKFDTAYVKDLSDKLAIRLMGINKYSRFSIENNSNDYLVEYAPNNNVNFGFGVNYKWFGLAMAFNFPFINNDDHIYGQTKRFDFQLNIYSRKYILDFYLQSYQGLYIDNPETYIPDWTIEMSYPQRPDIHTSSFGSNFVYIFNNKKYSSRAAYVQTELQKKSAGSFLLGGNISVFKIAGDSIFIPYQILQHFEEDLHFKDIEVSAIGVITGYTHTFVLWKKFYITLSLIPGISVQGYNVGYPDMQDNTSGSLVTGNFLIKSAFVYNSVKSFGGITLHSGNTFGYSNSKHKSNLLFETGAVRFFYGRRFNIYPEKKIPENETRIY